MAGLISAGSAAFLWALATILYKNTGKTEHPIKLNFLKGVIALGLLGATALITRSELTIPRPELFLLAISGIIGIGIGDTAYFYALKLIGAQQTLVIATLAPAVTILFGGLFLSEILTVQVFFSILLSIGGIILVILAGNVERQRFSWIGYGWAGLAMIAQAIGILLSRLAMKSHPLASLSSAIVRLFFGVIFILLIILLQKRNLFNFSFDTKNNFYWFLLAVFIGTYITIWLQQNALIFLDAGIAQTILSTSPIFIALLHLIQGYPVKLKTILGILLTVMGVFMLF